jgi:glycosyltransferase involved in cell wall biosynthesis
MSRVARDVTRALNVFGDVIPFCPPPGENAASTVYRCALSSFLHDIDVLWTDVYPSSALALTLREELQLFCPALFFVGGAAPKGIDALLFPWQHLLHSTDGLLFSSRADQQIWQQLAEQREIHEWVVPLPVDETEFYPRSDDECSAIRRRYHLPVNAPLLLYAGRLNIQKNLHSLLSLLKAVHQQIPDAHLCLVGEEDDISQVEFRVRNTGYGAWLRSLAAELEMTEFVHFLGPLFGEHLACLYAAADVVVNLSINHRENFGLSLAEAAACGTPVVCTSWGGFKDIVQEGESGYLVDAVLTKHGIRVNWRQGVDAVIKLLQHPSLSKQMGERAQVLAQERFRIASLSQHLAGVVEDVLSTDGISLGPAYVPSQLAHSLEEQKRACGWYASSPVVSLVQRQESTDEVALHWYPPMFQGRDYALYETLMHPYASRLAGEDHLPANWLACVPYFSSPVRLNALRHLIESDDPLWPHRQFLPFAAWEVIRHVDGHDTIEEIAMQSSCSPDACIAVLWAAYVEGFVLFLE